MENGHMEGLQPTFPPLYHGRSFHCYRDINKAIEKHREMYGLRLALKRAVKLENYCLTVEQMKDLNLRLKYGELDYHCFAATGRPGRPGNDERCPQLVRLKLSPDAQSLIVYETHNHSIIPHKEAPNNSLASINQMLNQPICIKGDITMTPIVTDSVPALPSSLTIVPVSKEDDQIPNAASFIINTRNSFTSLVPVGLTSTADLLRLKTQPEVSITIAQAPVKKDSDSCSPEGHEKITVKIKKSECVPNEMVVVGSLRHAQEQMKYKSFGSESSEKKSVSIEKVVSPPVVPVVPLSANKNETELNSPSGKICNNSNQKLLASKPTGLQRLAKFDNGGSGRPVQSIVRLHSPSTVPLKQQGQAGKPSLPNKQCISITPVVLKQASTMKQVIIDKPITKANISTKPVVLKQASTMKQVIIDKPIPKKTLDSKTQSGIESNSPLVRSTSPSVVNPGLKKTKPGLAITNNTGFPRSCSISTLGSSPPATDPFMRKALDRAKTEDQLHQGKPNEKSGTTSQKQTFTGLSTNGASNKLLIQKKFKKRPGRAPDSESSVHRASLDTELGFSEKQALAHGVLMQLLRVTSQLPMVQFSHALETLEDLTDAFRLNQRVNLSITHEEEEGFEFLNNNYEKKESCVAPSKSPLGTLQLDGQVDLSALLEVIATSGRSLGSPEEGDLFGKRVSDASYQLVVGKRMKR